MIPSIGLAGSFLGGQTATVLSPPPVGTPATWDPADKTANFALSNADLTASVDNATFETVRATRKDLGSADGGKYYWKVLVDSLLVPADCFIGLKQSSSGISSGTPFNSSGSYVVTRGNGSQVASGWTIAGTTSVFGGGSVLMFALDLTVGSLWTGINGVWDNSGNPAAGTNAPFTGMPAGVDFSPMCGTDNTAGIVTVTLVSDYASLIGDCPSGFTAGIYV